MSGPYNIRSETSVRDNQANKVNQTNPDWSRRATPECSARAHFRACAKPDLLPLQLNLYPFADVIVYLHWQ